MKSGQSRIDDAVAYIFQMGRQELAHHLLATALTGDASAIGKELSLGSRADGTDDPQYGSNTSKRQALRALLLCQRVYFSELWAQAILSGGVRQSASFLPLDWKQQSLTHWGPLTEQQIIQGILCFCATESTANRLADAADAAPMGNQPDVTLTRTKAPFPGLVSCYGAVMGWLLKSGLASFRWYMRNSGANNAGSLREAFGQATVIWPGNRPFTAKDNLQTVPRGHIVHLYVDNPLRWNGHWLVSLGDGRARACNNDDTDNTNRFYTSGCSLNNQFLNGYKEDAGNGPPEPGVAEVFDPTRIPRRM